MPNTGIKNVFTLRQVVAPCPGPDFDLCTCAPGCPTEPNQIGDPDYIAPYQDLVDCPVVYNTDCPIVVCTGASLSIVFEFGLGNAQIDNPAIDRVKIKAMLTGVEQGSVEFIFSAQTTPNYYAGTITGLAAATAYDIEIDYLLGVTVVDTCPSLDTVTTL